MSIAVSYPTPDDIDNGAEIDAAGLKGLLSNALSIDDITSIGVNYTALYTLLHAMIAKLDGANQTQKDNLNSREQSDAALVARMKNLEDTTANDKERINALDSKVAGLDTVVGKPVKDEKGDTSSLADRITILEAKSARLFEQPDKQSELDEELRRVSKVLADNQDLDEKHTKVINGIESGLEHLIDDKRANEKALARLEKRLDLFEELTMTDDADREADREDATERTPDEAATKVSTHTVTTSQKAATKGSTHTPPSQKATTKSDGKDHHHKPHGGDKKHERPTSRKGSRHSTDTGSPRKARKSWDRLKRNLRAATLPNIYQGTTEPQAEHESRRASAGAIASSTAMGRKRSSQWSSNGRSMGSRRGSSPRPMRKEGEPLTSRIMTLQDELDDLRNVVDNLRRKSAGLAGNDLKGLAHVVERCNENIEEQGQQAEKITKVLDEMAHSGVFPEPMVDKLESMIPDSKTAHKLRSVDSETLLVLDKWKYGEHVDAPVAHRVESSTTMMDGTAVAGTGTDQYQQQLRRLTADVARLKERQSHDQPSVDPRLSTKKQDEIHERLNQKINELQQEHEDLKDILTNMTGGLGVPLSGKPSISDFGGDSSKGKKRTSPACKMSGGLGDPLSGKPSKSDYFGVDSSKGKKRLSPAGKSSVRSIGHERDPHRGSLPRHSASTPITGREGRDSQYSKEAIHKSSSTSVHSGQLPLGFTEECIIKSPMPDDDDEDTLASTATVSDPRGQKQTAAQEHRVPPEQQPSTESGSSHINDDDRIAIGRRLALMEGKLKLQRNDIKKLLGTSERQGEHLLESDSRNLQLEAKIKENDTHIRDLMQRLAALVEKMKQAKDRKKVSLNRLGITEKLADQDLNRAESPTEVILSGFDQQLQKMSEDMDDLSLLWDRVDDMAEQQEQLKQSVKSVEDFGREFRNSLASSLAEAARRDSAEGSKLLDTFQDLTSHAMNSQTAMEKMLDELHAMKTRLVDYEDLQNAVKDLRQKQQQQQQQQQAEGKPDWPGTKTPPAVIFEDEAPPPENVASLQSGEPDVSDLQKKTASSGVSDAIPHAEGKTPAEIQKPAHVQKGGFGDDYLNQLCRLRKDIDMTRDKVAGLEDIQRRVANLENLTSDKGGLTDEPGARAAVTSIASDGAPLAAKSKVEALARCRDRLGKLEKVVQELMTNLNRQGIGMDSMPETFGWLRDEAAGLCKQIKIDFDCLSCGKPIKYTLKQAFPSIPMRPFLPARVSTAANHAYDLQDVRYDPKTGVHDHSVQRSVLDHSVQRSRLRSQQGVRPQRSVKESNVTLPKLADQDGEVQLSDISFLMGDQ